jgi:hypothetical protein
MDTTAAEATFTEIAFGLNIAFPFFSKCKEIHGFLVDKTMREDRALLRAVEDGEGLQVEDERVKIAKIEKQAKRRQHGLFLVCLIFSVISAFLCLIALYGNYLDQINGRELIYLVPLFCFIIGSIANILWFWWWEKKVMHHARALINARAHFHLPTLPPLTPPGVLPPASP